MKTSIKTPISLLQAPAQKKEREGGEEFGRVYLCTNGHRHYVQSIDRLADYGLRWPEDLIQVPDSIITSFRIGGWCPKIFAKSTRPEDINSSITMREFMSAGLTGIGLEVGAGASPFPVPLNCHVLFGDRIPHDKLIVELYPGQTSFDLVHPDILMDFDSFDGIADNSLDFIIGCHVIEHVRDPISTIVNGYRKLKPGGNLLLVIPDKERTFDKHRPLTKLQHLIDDYLVPDPERDRLHYEEFFRLAFPVPEIEIDVTVEKAVKSKTDIHFHVWNYSSFKELVNYVNTQYVAYSKIWSHPTLSDEKNDIEFYFRLTK
jgi:hypothetical protein